MIQCIFNARVSAFWRIAGGMDQDARKMRGDKPFIFSNLKSGQGLDAIVTFIIDKGMLSERLKL